MKYKLQLANGSSRRGAQMGRPNIIPIKQVEVRMHLTRLRGVPGDYDQFGAYWGNSGTSIYCAETDREYPWASNWDGSKQEPRTGLVFVRAHSRESAKLQVRKILVGTRVRFTH